MAKKILKLGIIGLGQAASKIIAEIRTAKDFPWVIAAAADPREHALQEFQLPLSQPLLWLFLAR